MRQKENSLGKIDDTHGKKRKIQQKKKKQCERTSKRDNRRLQIKVNNEMKIKLIPHIIYTKCRLAIFIHIFWCLLFVYLFICLAVSFFRRSLFLSHCLFAVRFFGQFIRSHFTFAVATSPTSAMYHSFILLLLNVFFFGLFVCFFFVAHSPRAT